MGRDAAGGLQGPRAPVVQAPEPRGTAEIIRVFSMVPTPSGQIGARRVRVAWVMVDGIADVSIPDLGRKTPLQYVQVPTFDSVASCGISGLMDPVQVCGHESASIEQPRAVIVLGCGWSQIPPRGDNWVEYRFRAAGWPGVRE